VRAGAGGGRRRGLGESVGGRRPGRLAGVAAVVVCAAVALAENSGGYRGPNRNGVFPAQGLLREWPEGGPELVWKTEGLGDGYGAPCVVDGEVYVTGSTFRKSADGKREGTGTVFAFGPDGRLRWKREYGREIVKSSFRGPRATPAVHDGCVYFASGVADLYCMDTADGTLRWKVNIWGDLGDGGGAKRMGWGYNESPLLVGDLVIVNTCSTSKGGSPVVAVNCRTGEVVWAADPGPGNLSAADGSVIAARCGNRTLVIAHTYRQVLGLDASDGRTLWSLDAHKGAGMTPVHFGGHLLLGHKRGLRLMTLGRDGAMCEQVWVVEEPRKEDPPRETPPIVLGYEPPVVLGDCIHFAKFRHTDVTQTWLATMRLDTGEEIWSRASQQEGWPPRPPTFAAAEGLLYVLEGGPRCSLARPTDKGLEEISSFRPALGFGPTFTHPVIAEGRLFLRQGPRLAVYDVRAKRMDPPAPSEGQD